MTSGSKIVRLRPLLERCSHHWVWDDRHKIWFCAYCGVRK